NTASARVYLKQMNRENEVLLEKVAEPLATFSYMHGGKYDHDMLAYAWKTLMQNHPHDSICGCSVDEVHREMVTRFEKAKHVTEMIVDESLESITSNINTNEFSKYGEDSLPFTVYNTTGYSRTGAVSVIIDVKREYFADGVNQDKLRSFDLGDKKLVDVEGNVYSFEMEDLGIEFDYDLPNDKFRQPYMARRVKLTFEAQDVPALGYKTFAWVNANASEKMAEAGSLIAGEHAMENEYLHVDIAGDGSLSVTEKATGRTYTDLCVYEDTGDIGNEYMYKQPNGEEALTTKDVPATINLVEDTPFRATYQIVHEWELPKSATDLDIAGDGSLSVTEKATGRTYTDLCVYEDTGDIGNEYMYKQPNGEEALTTKDVPATINLVEDTPFRATYQIVHEWELPKSATD